MSITIVSHTPVDIIEGKTKVATVGGPTSYAGATATAMGFEVRLVTKIGKDFPPEFRRVLLERGLSISSRCISSTSPTTRFRLVLKNRERDLFLLARCEDIGADDMEADADAYIVSPVINELGTDALSRARGHAGFLFLDPQGFVRRVGADGRCYTAGTELPLDRLGIDAIKVDPDEAHALTGLQDREALRKLKASIAILTNRNKTTMLHNDRFYEIATEFVDTMDSTGAGDIFGGAYTCSYIKEGDPRWALCIAVAASLEALRSGAMGLAKIPSKSRITSHACVLHELLKPQS